MELNARAGVGHPARPAHRFVDAHAIVTPLDPLRGAHDVGDRP
jgi:hypothetical protein